MKPCLLSLVLAVGGWAGTTAAVGMPRLVIAHAHVEIELPIDMQKVDVAFPFKNASGSTVRIREIVAECDCVQTMVEPSEIEPGQTGEIRLQFRAKVRSGTEVIRAEVITDGSETYPISVTAKLSSHIEVTPRTLDWKKGESREPREFVVSATGLGKLRFTHVAAVRDAKVEMFPGEDSTSIRILVTPPSGDKRFQSVVLVTATLEETGETKVYDLHVRGE